MPEDCVAMVNSVVTPKSSILNEINELKRYVPETLLNPELMNPDAHLVTP